ncbi:MAG: hypothetical protein EOP56_11070 [Sphingobacteriales bacterium]|nr:MAG: hypothetical protein EOP56_11070 [Sphingobacteriales bacterium]
MSIAERIPFNIKVADGTFRGEAIGITDTLKANSMFEVRLNTGDRLLLEAVPDYETRRMTWASRAQTELTKLVPVIGRVIERYFSKKK